MSITNNLIEYEKFIPKLQRLFKLLKVMSIFAEETNHKLLLSK